MKLKSLTKPKLSKTLHWLFSFKDFDNNTSERNAAELIIILLEARSKNNLEVKVKQND